MFFLRMILGVFLFLQVVSAQGFIHADGTNIVEGNGEPILLRGFGLGGWLVPEGYMLHNQAWIEGFESPTQIENHILDLVGADFVDDFWDLYRANYVAQADIDQIADWGFNHLRIPFHYKQFYDDSSGVEPIGYGLIDTLISWCEPHDIYIILDMHCAPGGQNGGPISDSDGTARLWLDENNKDLTIQIWQEIADYYSEETLIAGYDLINEPVLPEGISTADLRQLFVDITTAIREVDPNHMVLAEGNWYGTDFTGLTPPWDDNMGYSFHKYWGETSLNTIQSYLSMSNTHDVPLWMGESGENSNQWYYEVFNLLEENNIGWNFWTHKKVEKISSPYSAIVSPQYQTILNYWSGNGTQPSELYAQAVLMDFANSLKIENCLVLPGVVASLTDPEYGQISKPYRPHAIPGTIPAVEYDIGARGISYSDADYLNDGDGSYNSGWTFRNDGVDIEANPDFNGMPYNVGWMEIGDWLGYTLTEISPGTYNIHFSIAAPNAGGILVPQLGGQNLGIVNIPGTGGWHDWDEVTLSNVVFDGEQNFFKLLVVQGGFNIEAIRFEQTTVSVSDHVSPERFRVSEPYPNPFNPATTLSYHLPEERFVKITIHDMQGRVIKALVAGQQLKGTHSVQWSGLNEMNQAMPTGVYLYRIETGSFSETRKVVLLK
jgi:endoglucanase